MVPFQINMEKKITKSNNKQNTLNAKHGEKQMYP